MESLFSVGDEVICVRSNNYAGLPLSQIDMVPQLVEGKKYIIRGLKNCHHCGECWVDVGLSVPVYTNGRIWCSECKRPDSQIAGKVWWLSQYRFVKADTNKQLEENIFEALKEDLKVKNFQDN